MLRYLTPRAALGARTAGLRHGYLPKSTGARRAVNTFANQDQLPRLPIPTLDATATRYLKSLRPLLTSAEYGAAEKAVSAFIQSDGMGPVLQKRLEEVDKREPASWLEKIWLTKAYLEWREPNYINSNWWALLADNPDIPLMDSEVKGRPTSVQLLRAARCITHLLEENERLNGGKMEPEMQRDVPLCMNQFKWQFGTSRIAREKCDELVHQYPSTSRHILVMYRNQSVIVPVYGSSTGERASLEQIAWQLIKTIRQVDKEHPYEKKERGAIKDIKACEDLKAPSVVSWVVTQSLGDTIKAVRVEAKKLADNLRVHLENVDEFGSSWIKTLGVSPDAFFQVVLQAAYYQQHGKPAPTYETASLRRFLHGRTETIRSCTEESLAFSKALGDAKVPLGTKIQLFKDAAAAHVEYMKAASSGQGVDRHLLGLRAQIQGPKEAKKATLFQDPSYVKSMSFALSTSNVTTGDRLRGAFAPVILDGYGVNYALERDHIRFTVTEWISSSATDGTLFSASIRETLAKLHEAGKQAIASQ
ncbi:hypothetical protein GGF46_002233 [Coemansia sp. RSA 552]|nr:hypothetical protein GGF46_002233 [Coemansia sp. RSA 552]